MSARCAHVCSSTPRGRARPAQRSWASLGVLRAERTLFSHSDSTTLVTDVGVLQSVTGVKNSGQVRSAPGPRLRS